MSQFNIECQKQTQLALLKMIEEITPIAQAEGVSPVELFTDLGHAIASFGYTLFFNKEEGEPLQQVEKNSLVDCLEAFTMGFEERLEILSDRDRLASIIVPHPEYAH